MKRCSKCRIEKPLDAFTTAPSNKDGRYSYCNSCRHWLYANQRLPCDRSEWDRREQERSAWREQGLKQCRGCGEVKPLEAFHIDSSASDGHKGQCKMCYLRYQRRLHHEHREEFNARKRARRAQQTDEQRLHNNAYQRHHRVGIRDAKWLEYEAAVAAGEMKRCATCGHEKPAGEFYFLPHTKHGIGSYCRPCTYARQQAARTRRAS